MKKLKHIILLTVVSYTSFSQTLKQNFETPPNSAKPRVWWHWMNGNITKEGIQKDLEWMNRVGIGGFQNFDANLFTPVVVPKKLVFMDKNWKDAFKFTTDLANKTGLEMAIAGSPGWSVTGGPWVEAKDGMKKYVWTETKVEGGKPFSGKLPQPSGVLSNFQNAEISSEGFVGIKPNFYHDAAVIAFRISNSEKKLADMNPIVTSSGGVFNIKSLTDGDLNTATMLPPKEIGEDMWIQYEFDSPQTFKALSVVGAVHNQMEQFNGSPQNRSLKVSDDGINFREVAKIHGSGIPQTSVSFAATAAKYFRFCYQTLPGQPAGFAAMMGGASGPLKPDGVNVAEFVLYNTDRIDKFEDKAGFTPWKENLRVQEEGSGKDVINPVDIIDLSDKMQADGTLNWEVPAGIWGVLRFGYSLTGRQNHPASPEATGLEVDKLDQEAVKKYINTYLDMYNDATGGMMGAKGLQFMVLDSYEAGHMNWSKTFLDDFQKKRGYDIKKWIPVLTGRFVENVEKSEQFLWDFRKTIGELISENHYDVIGEELHKRGMKRYTESHEGGRIYLADGMDVKRNADIPMAAMWTPGSLAGGGEEEVRSEADIRESASVANIYGQNIVAAESMTSIQNAFSWHPEKLKRTADLEMASGLNRFVIHTSVHQPLDKGPGFSLGPFGQYFTRLETWSGAGAKAWMSYLGRSSQMLQQGKNIADILYYYGENTNITWLSREKLPNIPKGYEFDYANSSALINAIDVKNGQIVAKSGNSYKLLVLDETAKFMTLPVLKRINNLVKSGLKLVGVKPELSPSLTDNAAEFQAISNELWMNPNVIKTNTNDALKSLKVAEDVVITKNSAKILFRHRKISPSNGQGSDIYWLNNRSDAQNQAEISFRIAGMVPELWNPIDGKTSKLSYKIIDGRTIVSLQFDAWDAFFIVFKEKSLSNSVTLKTKPETNLLQISNGWKVKFADKIVDFAKLNSWSENSDLDIKYFSGSADYTNSFNLSNVNRDTKYEINLGEVKNIAEVTVNGKNMGTVWKKPFKLDISQGIKKGENTIEIKVTNLWVNRLIGDAQPKVQQKTTFTTMPFYRANSPLLPSGLLGPIAINTK